jgi:S1-C subfamily serine protease
MMNGTTVDNTVAGGPAYNSKLMAHGDVILEVDDREAKNENIFELLIGCDVPGSVVHIKLAKGGPTVVHAFSDCCP